jgi:hypothetical protein
VVDQREDARVFIWFGTMAYVNMEVITSIGYIFMIGAIYNILG